MSTLKDFLLKAWRSRLKSSLQALPAVATGILVNHQAGLTDPSGAWRVPLPLALDLFLLGLGVLYAVGGVAYSYYEDLEALKKTHAEEEQVREGVLFKRGKRTGGQWLPFCPVCQRPANTDVLVRCPAPACNWHTLKGKKQMAELVVALG